ncbi:hypothetical protein JCM10450v2_007416 [Rhodotorula kratochvilovae]
MAAPELVDVPTPVPGIRICYDFITEQEEAYLLEKIDAAGGGPAAASATSGEGEPGDGAGGEGAPAHAAAAGKKSWGWKELNGRRSMYWGGTVLPSGSLIPSPFPAFMDNAWPNVLDRIAQLGVYDEYSGSKGKGKERGPNHCLVNEYLPGQGIMPHTDGPAYHPLTSTLSLGSHTILCLRSPPSHLTPDSPAFEVEKVDILLPPRSLVLLSGELYSTWLHGIQPLAGDSLPSLSGCANWAGWWEFQLAAAVDESARQEVKKAREMVEAGKGWERGKRVSLTCRRPRGKVRSGILGLR